MTHSTTKIRSLVFAIGLLVISVLACSSCSQLIDPNVPEPLIPRVEPTQGRQYLIYRPTRYDADYHWPLVVVLHGGFPDSANSRIRAWTTLAESHGFLIVAPTLQSTRTLWLGKTEQQLDQLRQDEQQILSIIRHFRAGQNVSRDRIFMHGFGKGAISALYTGLRHPGLFRAITVSQPKFDETLLAPTANLVDHHQPVLVHYDLSDAIFGHQAKACIQWLRDRGANLTDDSHGKELSTNAERSVQFFKDLLRRQGWYRIRAYASGEVNPLEIQFKLRCDGSPAAFQWDFGDGSTSNLAEPVHTYNKPGVYRVVVTVTDQKRKRHRRSATLKVPEATLAISKTNNLSS